MSKFELTVNSTFWTDKTQWPSEFYLMCESLAQIAPSYESRPSPVGILIPDSQDAAFETAFTGLRDVIRLRRRS